MQTAPWTRCHWDPSTDLFDDLVAFSSSNSDLSPCKQHFSPTESKLWLRNHTCLIFLFFNRSLIVFTHLFPPNFVNHFEFFRCSMALQQVRTQTWAPAGVISPSLLTWKTWKDSDYAHVVYLVSPICRTHRTCFFLHLCRLPGAEGSWLQSGEICCLWDLWGLSCCVNSQPWWEDHPCWRCSIHHRGTCTFTLSTYF